MFFITRPHHWGKSLNFSMVEAFFDINADAAKKERKAKIFTELKIGKQSEGAYLKEMFSSPVLAVNFRFSGKSFEKMLPSLKSYLSRLYDHYQKEYSFMEELQKLPDKKDYLKYQRLRNGKDTEGETLSMQDLKDCFRFMIDLMYERHKAPVVFLIDDADYPLTQMMFEQTDVFLSAMTNQQDKEKVHKEMSEAHELLYEMINAQALDVPDSRVRFIMMAGTSNTLVTNHLMKNFELNTIEMPELGEHFGVYHEEIQYIVNTIFKEDAKQEIKDLVHTTIQRYFNGYEGKNVPNRFYNIWSVINYIKDFYEKDIKEGRAIWVSIDNYQTIRWIKPLYTEDKLVKSWLIKNLFEMSRKKTVPASFFPVTDTNTCNVEDVIEGNMENFVLNLLISQGYVTYSGDSFRLPNFEVQQLFAYEIIPYYCCRFLKQDLELCRNQLPELLNRNLNNDEKFDKLLQERIMKRVPPNEKSEGFFEKLLGGLIEFCALRNHKKALYTSLPKNPHYDGTIETLFSPNTWRRLTSDNDCFIIHKYTRTKKNGVYNVKETSENVIWHILCKNHLAQTLTEVKSIYPKRPFNIKIRPVVFHFDENEKRCQMDLKSYKFTFEEARKVQEFFENSLTKSELAHLCDTSNKSNLFDTRKKFLDAYNKRGLSELLDEIKVSDKKLPNYEDQMKDGPNEQRNNLSNWRDAEMDEQDNNNNYRNDNNSVDDDYIDEQAEFKLDKKKSSQRPNNNSSRPSNQYNNNSRSSNSRPSNQNSRRPAQQRQSNNNSNSNGNGNNSRNNRNQAKNSQPPDNWRSKLKKKPPPSEQKTETQTEENQDDFDDYDEEFKFKQRPSSQNTNNRCTVNFLKLV